MSARMATAEETIAMPWLLPPAIRKWQTERAPGWHVHLSWENWAQDGSECCRLPGSWRRLKNRPSLTLGLLSLPSYCCRVWYQQKRTPRLQFPSTLWFVLLTYKTMVPQSSPLGRWLTGLDGIALSFKHLLERERNGLLFNVVCDVFFSKNTDW